LSIGDEEMKSQQIIAVLAVGAILGISGLFIALPASPQNSIITTEMFTQDPLIRNVSMYGNPTSINGLSPGVEIVNLSSPEVAPMDLYLVQIRQNGSFLIYNQTNAMHFVPGWDENFTALVMVESGTNYTYPFNRVHEILGQYCNQNISLGPTGCSIITTISQSQPNIQVTNFTLSNGAKGWAYQDFATWWDNGHQYSINSAGMTVPQVIEIAQSMKPVSTKGS